MSHREFDVIVVGAGPAGSSCARFLTEAGKRVVILDRVSFPRVKLCAGWLSNPVWTELALTPDDYDRSLWKWNRCYVHFGGNCHQVEVDGFFIRRVEFDDFLVRQSGAELVEHQVKSIVREGTDWIIDETFRAPVVVGAAGTHCPVARALYGRRPNRPSGARELEFQLNEDDIRATRAGLNGEPELYLHSDLRGYSWNIPKSDWLNVGTGTLEAKQVHAAWAEARDVFDAAGHLPASAAPSLEKMKGHSYYLFQPAHLDRSGRDGIVLVGDSIGLAHPLTAEGILPAITSARIAADLIVVNKLARYRDQLANHRLFREYATLWRLRDTAGALRSRSRESDYSVDRQAAGLFGRMLKRVAGQRVELAASWLIARGFAWMFAGRSIPAYQAVGSIIHTARRWDRFVSEDVLSQRKLGGKPETLIKPTRDSRETVSQDQSQQGQSQHEATRFNGIHSADSV